VPDRQEGARYPVVPAALLGRLAVTGNYRGKGLAGILFSDAILRAARAEPGVFAMVADAKDAAARRFYEQYGFALTAGEVRRLYLPIALAFG
jgi:predicted GNAT family N-acyltransferase